MPAVSGLQVPILSRALAHSLAVDIDHTRVRPGKRVSEQHMKYLSSVVQWGMIVLFLKRPLVFLTGLASFSVRSYGRAIFS